ncbi:O-antigen ligase family protein [uncultured Tateyamaria sp.]|uniref:O-antigen ligase family protein n=1 Tax=uncultured Tateyamaria sp. TaxID=455651 RepID=UPI00261CC655|nr:O-antigen ligase family protein [uncultured Tateyamaria sp.]
MTALASPITAQEAGPVEKRLPGHYVVTTFVVTFASALLLGVSPAMAVPGILAGIFLLVAKVVVTPIIPRVAFLALLFVLYALISAIMFDGIRSLGVSGPVAWLGGEGRIFIYYWPFIFLTVALYHHTANVESRLETALLWLTIFAFLVIVAQRSGVAALYSSHHAAGAVMTSLVVFNYFRYQNHKSLWALIFLGIAMAGLLGTGSRASLMAVILGIVIQQMIGVRIIQVLKFVLLVPIFMVGMSIAYPDQYERLSRTFQVNPMTVITTNFDRAWQADPPLESSEAWALSSYADKQGQANLAIRGLLWARGVAEGFKSPIFGTGFGRYNDMGREFNDTLPLVAVVTDASFLNASAHTSHNSFIMIFTELGLIGVALIGGMFVIIIRTALRVLRHPNVRPNAKMWAGITLGCTVTLMLISITQHGFGAPIYGLTLMQLIAIGYCVSAREIRA